jgi:hypothetical protein
MSTRTRAASLGERLTRLSLAQQEAAIASCRRSRISTDMPGRIQSQTDSPSGVALAARMNAALPE